MSKLKTKAKESTAPSTKKVEVKTVAPAKTDQNQKQISKGTPKAPER